MSLVEVSEAFATTCGAVEEALGYRHYGGVVEVLLDA